MKQRLKTILQVLRKSDDYITITELARITGAGVRTVHRDLDSLGRSLGFRNVRLERRRGFGVRILDPLPASYASQILDTARDDELPSGDQRILLILLYLVLESDWVKLNQLALDFHVSDSSISRDLNDLELKIPSEISLLRQKGVGVKLQASELLLRKLFIVALPVVFPPHEISSLFSSGRDSRSWFLNHLGAADSAPAVRQGIDACREVLGMRFSPRHELLLGAYLMLMVHRIHQDRPEPDQGKDGDFVLPVPELYSDAAEEICNVIMDDLSASQEYQNTPPFSHPEKRLLGRLLSSLEPSGIIGADSRDLLGESYESVKGIVEHTLHDLEEANLLWLHDDQNLIEYLRITVSAVFHRIDMLYSPSPDFFSPESSMSPDGPVAELLGKYAIGGLGSILPGFSPSIFVREAEEAVLALEARMERRQSRARIPLNVKILCYEGLGMSNYLKILAEKVLPPGSRIDTSWENDFSDSRARAGQFNMLISTFPVDGLSIPHVLVTEGKNRQAIIDSIRSTLDGLLDQQDDLPADMDNAILASDTDSSEAISISSVMGILHDFVFLSRNETGSIIDQAADAFSGAGVDREQLKKDFIRREGYGSLVFEEYGIQLLHCRTSAVDRPRVGVLQSRGTEPSLLLMAAPAGSTSAENRVLSEIVITLGEDPEFAKILTTGSLEDIQSRLFQHFGQLMNG